MIAASARLQSAPEAKLLFVDSGGAIREWPRSQFAELLRPGDVVIANDAAVLPASLFGRHVPSGGRIEVRLAGRRTLDEIRRFSAIVFGEGDFRMRTEDRPDPPSLHVGDRLELGPLNAIVADVLDHPRHVLLNLQGSPRQIWEGLARHGRPIQYAHLATPLALWDVWTAIAGPPMAFEPPSAGFALDWRVLASLPGRGVRFGAITHAAGVSSTGDPKLDALLPFDEPYRIPRSTARLIAEAQSRGGRIVAIGTTVVRALEHSAAIFCGFVPAGERAATQKIGLSSRLRVVDAILTGVHEQGSSHHELLRAFAGDETLELVGGELSARGFRTHEFGDSLFLEKAVRRWPAEPAG
jgi:S-adenosylmethionine:tRNA ribosyltransferase-isomerase